MRRCLSYLLILLLPLLSACHSRQMREELSSLQQRNQSDFPMTDDSLAAALCSYFDRHGTSNERLMAHYLLARTYADLGQASHALDEYHRAAEQADTAEADCDYKTLARVFGQMGDVL